MASESIAYEAIDSEPIRARGIIVKYPIINLTEYCHSVVGPNTGR